MLDLTKKSIQPWIEAKNRHDIVIAAVSSAFKEMVELGVPDIDDGTQKYLQSITPKGINYLWIQTPRENINDYKTEYEVRNEGLKYLLEAGVTDVLILDSDEIFTDKEIDNLIEYVNWPESQLYGWFKIRYKNLTFDDKHYTNDFTPPRWFRVNINGYRLNTCVYDNNFSYHGTITRDIVTEQKFPSKVIPSSLVHPLHHSWNDPERSKKKINYHLKRWSPPNGNGCSFQWNNDKNCLEWNEDYYRRFGISIPELHKL